MSVDDTSRPGDDETDTRAAADGSARGDTPADDRRPTPTALRATGPAVTIEFGRETGEIRIRRETALGTVTESVDR
jgi:hypothetical protein